MITHLSPDEQIAAIEDRLDAARAGHLTDCAACRSSVDEGRRVLALVADIDVPEPSPLFWDHLAARIGRATPDVPRPSRGRWRGLRWPAFTAAAIAVVAIALALRSTVVRAPGEPAVAPSTIAAVPEPAPVSPDRPDPDAADDSPWTDVVQMAAGLSTDDLHGVAALDVSPLVADLNPAEREAFVRLLRAEMEPHQ
jgi:hypothetical protein